MVSAKFRKSASHSIAGVMNFQKAQKAAYRGCAEIPESLERLKSLKARVAKGLLGVQDPLEVPMSINARGAIGCSGPHRFRDFQRHGGFFGIQGTLTSTAFRLPCPHGRPDATPGLLACYANAGRESLRGRIIPQFPIFHCVTYRVFFFAYQFLA